MFRLHMHHEGVVYMHHEGVGVVCMHLEGIVAFRLRRRSCIKYLYKRLVEASLRWIQNHIDCEDQGQFAVQDVYFSAFSDQTDLCL